MTAAKPRRRWFQFSLGSLFVLLTVLCVWLGVTVNRARKQREAVAAIEELGGWLAYDYEVDSSGNSLIYAKPPGPKWLREFVGEEYFVSVVVVGPRNPQVTDAGLVHLKGFSKLGFLHLEDTQVTDAGLEHLKGLTKLEQLWLNDTQVTDAGLVHLKGLTNLKYLNLENTQVTNVGVKKLQQALPNCGISH